jgi:hypothetical protein
MRRLFATSLLLMPLIAAGQTLGDSKVDAATADRLLQQRPDQMAEVQPGVLVPLWRAADGRMLALKADTNLSTTAPLSFRAVDASTALSTGLQYDLGAHLQAHAAVTERSWVNTAVDTCSYADAVNSANCNALGSPPKIIGSEVGATYSTGGYSLGLGIGSARPSNVASGLPRVLPGGSPGVSTAFGLPLDTLGTSTELNARGRLAFDAKSGLDLGASVGRVRLLPGNLLGINSVDQKALSFGVDRGPLSGSIVGRTMQPEAGIVNALNSGDRRWTAVDLGVTWRLPWRGELSFGAQNVWSSGSAPAAASGPEPDQSRTPYVQYHQDL